MQKLTKADIIKCKHDARAPLNLDGERVDPFYYEQPSLDFVKELKKPIYESRPLGYGERCAEIGETDASGIYIDAADFADEPLLETALDSFERFAKIYGIGGERYPVILKKVDTDTPEWHKICFSEKETTVYAGDIEGARRAIYYIEGELILREGAYLEAGEITRSPIVKSRITRGFFSPTNRPPKLGDELLDDTDYYPEGFLDRLAHDGTNGIWIYTSFKQLMRSARFERCGEECDRRIEKLKSVIAKCARYGVKVYLLAIEPAYLVNEEAEKNVDMLGGHVPLGQYAICTSSKEGREYLSESVEALFRLVPDLGGYIDITSGERVTSCASFIETHRTCPICSEKPIGEVLADTANLIKNAIRRLGTGAEFISWTYGHKTWQGDDIREYVRKCDTDIALMQNFEEYSYNEQFGKVRQGKDYWLSYPGPGELFRLTGEESLARGKKLYAKMQICCSHELASMPYIPAPGLVFDKFKGARQYGVSGVVECWYFGNYPSVMSRAAGELSFESEFSDKGAFLKRLAATYYGKSRADKVSEAWRFFEEGYKNYPLNIMFSYYGPMHDSVVWELQLLPKDRYLSRSWLLIDKPDGDRIYEALWYGHTLDEALSLTERINESWKKGLSVLPLDESDEAATLAKGLGLLFASGENILRFYKLRRELGMGIGDAKVLLSAMRGIVEEEIEHSAEMAELCKKDKRLGYHSEAEGFKFFPKKLESRIEYLKKLLATEFKEVAERIEKGLFPLEFYEGKTNGEYPENTYFVDNGEGKWCTVRNTAHHFRISLDNDSVTLTLDAKTEKDIILGFEFEPLIPTPTVTFGKEGKVDFIGEVYSHQSMFGEKIEAEKKKYSLTVQKTDEGVIYSVTMKNSDFGRREKSPFRIRLTVGGAALNETKIKLRLLAKWNEYPDMYSWVIPR